jgi:hypothetical protein
MSVLQHSDPAHSAPLHAMRARPAAVLRRKCACGGTPGPTGECEECRRKRLQRSAAVPGPAMAPPVVHDVLASPGRPLDPAVRAEMEPRFRHSFADVRVHADGRAAESARAVGAHAYAVGTSVVFGAGRYAPGSAEGRRLIAHELAHVVQQRGASPALQPRLEIGAADDPAEREADQAAAGAVPHGPRTEGIRLRRVPEEQGFGSLHGDGISGGHTVPRHGSTLPYREATELATCIRIMGAGSEQYCREEVLGERPPATHPARTAAAGTSGTHAGSRYVVYENEVRVGGTRAWRNNNPGNIQAGAFATGEGAIGSDGRFAIFPDEQTGSAAIVTLLRRPSYQVLTIRGAVFRYAPPNENNTAGYLATITRVTGLSPDTQMNTLTDPQLDSVAATIRSVEGWRAGDTFTCASAQGPAAWVRPLLGCP